MHVGPSIPFYLLVLVWIGRMVLVTFICTILGWLGIRVLDVLTPHIHQREKIGENPTAVGIFIAGFIIFIGLIIHGNCTAPMVIGGALIDSLIDLRRLGLMSICFFASLLVGIVVFDIVNRLTPRIPFLSIKDDSIAVGIYVFGYLIFLGIILHSALAMSL